MADLIGSIQAGADALWLLSEKAKPGNQVNIQRKEQALALRALAEWMEKPLIDPAMGTRADHIARKIEALAAPMEGESDD